jgi:cytochrome bd-type quinol oxidase subunit 1
MSAMPSALPVFVPLALTLTLVLCGTDALMLVHEVEHACTVFAMMNALLSVGPAVGLVAGLVASSL